MTLTNAETEKAALLALECRQPPPVNMLDDSIFQLHTLSYSHFMNPFFRPGAQGPQIAAVLHLQGDAKGISDGVRGLFF